MADLSEGARLAIQFVNGKPPGYHTKLSLVGALRYHYTEIGKDDPGLKDTKKNFQEALGSGEIVEIGTGMLKALYPRGWEG